MAIVCVFCLILGQIHPNQFSWLQIFQKQAVQDCAAARESLNACEECQYAIKRKNCIHKLRQTARKSGYSCCSKFIRIRNGALSFIKFMQQNVTLLPFT